MKNILLLILICFAQNMFSQEVAKTSTTDYDDKIFNATTIDVKPEFPGGLEAMNSFIKQNFKSQKEGLKGKIYVSLIIEKDGSLSNINILRDLGYETGAEAIRVLKLFPKWSPGKQNNKNIRVLYFISMAIN